MGKAFYKTLGVFLALLLATQIINVAEAASTEDFNHSEVFFPVAKEVEVTIIMYHLITENPKYIGKYGVTPAELEQDLIYLKENGYNTVTMQDLIAFVNQGKKLPKNPIVLTFDDGNFSDYTYLLPLLEKHDAKAVLAIMGGVSDKYTKDAQDNPKAKYPNLTWPQIKALHESGLCDIQSHGYNVHGKGGSGKSRNESQGAYHSRLMADLKKLQDACHINLGHVPNTFVYPLGVVSQGSRQVLEELGMVASLGCEEGVNTLRQGDKDCLFTMKRYNRPSGKGIGAFLKK